MEFLIIPIIVLGFSLPFLLPVIFFIFLLKAINKNIRQNSQPQTQPASKKKPLILLVLFIAAVFVPIYIFGIIPNSCDDMSCGMGAAFIILIIGILGLGIVPIAVIFLVRRLMKPKNPPANQQPPSNS